MKVQRVRIPDSDRVTWLVLNDNYLAVPPIQNFLTYQEHLERSPNTVRAYAYHLKLWWEYLQHRQLDWTAIQLSDLADFVAWLRAPQPDVVSLQAQTARRTETTINAILTAVTVFYDYHHRLGTTPSISLYQGQRQSQRRYKGLLHHITQKKPTRSRLIKLKERRRLPQTITYDQFKALVRACNNKRDSFLLCLLYETGMRIGQALGLRHEDIHSWDNEVLIVPRDENINRMRAKGRATYIIHVSPELMMLYTDYLLSEFDDIDSDYVFVNIWEGVRGRPMSYAAVADLFARLSSKTGIVIRPHMLRHTHATELLRAGWDASYVQQRLGHASVQTTIQTYAHLTNDDLKEAYQAYLDERTRKS